MTTDQPGAGSPSVLRGRLPAGLASSVLAPAVAATLAVTVVVAGWRGTDLAAQVFRADLFRRYGFVLWNGQWFGGHATLSYSVLTPMLSALVGPVMVAGLSAVAAALVFDRIVRRQFGIVSRTGSVWFAVGTAVNVVIGRVPFALGIAFGLAVILLLQRDRVLAATAAAMLTTLASPVAGVFVLIVATAWALSSRTRWLTGLAVSAAVVLPLASVSLLFPDGGVFPYEPWAFALDIAIGAVFFCLTRTHHPALRVGAVLYVLVVTAAFVMPTALGGNVSRFSQFFAGPVLACVLWPRRKVVVGLLAVPLLFWQWMPAAQTIAAGHQAVETSRSFYQPLVDYVQAQGPVPGRLEIPVTARHWESAYVADRVPLARGWERQLDLTYDHIFYDGTLNAASYERWLSDNAVQFVALPDAHLDDASIAERNLLEGGLSYLTPAWHDPHWQGMALHRLPRPRRRVGDRRPPRRDRLHPSRRRTRRRPAARPTVVALEPRRRRVRRRDRGWVDTTRGAQGRDRGDHPAMARHTLPLT